MIELSQRQFGFRKAVDTVQYVLRRVRNCRRGYVALIMFDVRNAFNTAPWDVIEGRARRRIGEAGMKTIIRDYLKERKIEVGRELVMDQTMVVPQGSVLGPVLGKIFYDEVLGVELPGGCELVAYADDLVLVAADLGIESLKSKVEVAIRRIGRWMDGSRLKLAPEKKEAITLHRSHRRVNEISFRHDQVDITPSRVVK